MFKFISTIALIGAISIGSANAASVLQNGSFEEDPDVAGNRGADFSQMNTSGRSWDIWDALPGWQKGVNSADGIEIQSNRTLNSIDAQHGNYYVELDSNKNSRMFQSVALDVGQYVLSFFYSPRKSDVRTNGIQVKVGNGTDIFDETFEGPGGALGSAVGVWTEIVRNINVTTAGNYNLAFKAVGTDDSLGGFIDNVSLAPVPLPAPALLLAAALGGLGVTRKLRKNA